MGRSLQYKTSEELEAKCNEYFDICDETDEPYTVPGLAYELGFESRTSIWNYKSKKNYMNTIKRALERIERQRVAKMLKGGQNVAGCIFDLKNNFGYKDKIEQEITGPGGGPIAIAAYPPNPDTIALWEQQVIQSREHIKAKMLPKKT